MSLSTVGAGKDYATLQAWSDAVYGSDPDPVAECYSGSDLGLLVGEDIYPRTIYVASGHQHNGTDAGTSGVAYSSTGLNWNGSLSVNGLQFMDSIVLGASSLYNIACDFVVENVLFIATKNLSTSVAIVAQAYSNDSSTPLTDTCVIRNTIILNQSGINNAIGIEQYDGFTTFNVELYNNTIIRSGGTMNPGIYLTSDTDDMLTVTVSNNIVIGPTAGRCYFTLPGSAVFAVNGSYNLSSDATADDWGATGAVLNQTPADVVVNTSTDPTLKSTSAAKDAGTDLSGTGFSTDAIGTDRPQGAAWDMGALELTEPAIAPGLYFGWIIGGAVGGRIVGG